jgi:hypothetical protein
LGEVKLKEISEFSDLKMTNLKQEIDQQLRLANDNLIKEQLIKIQEVKESTDFKIAQQK